ncbi:MAG: hypothetical protein JWO08_1696 [Verrucomicrobiaceae bacterium]|nr:hypothetical protein [Verrucomicrobiaceae bacterium]
MSHKKPDRKKPEFITIDDFLRLTGEADTESKLRKPPPKTEKKREKRQALICWLCVVGVFGFSCMQGFALHGFKMETGAFGTLVTVLVGAVVTLVVGKR